jgi:ABC-type multidrug transport system fused ATPase/permease subunit
MLALMVSHGVLRRGSSRAACAVSAATWRGVASAAAFAPPAPVVLPVVPEKSVWTTVKSVLAAGKAAKAADKDKNGADDKGPLDVGSVVRLLRLIRPEAATLGGAVATLGITTAISLLFPYAIGQVLDVAVIGSQAAAAVGAGGGGAATASAVDAVSSTGSASSAALPSLRGYSVSTLSAGLLGLFFVQSGLIVLRSALLTIAGERMSATLRKALFRAVMRQETAWHDKQRTGDVINRLSSDTAVLQKALTSNIANGLRSLFMTVGGVGALVMLSPPLAALSLSLIPPVALAGVTYGRYVAGQQKRVQEALGVTMQVAEEAISSHRTVRQFTGEAREDARFRAAVDESYTLARRIGIVAAYFDGGVHAAANVGLIAVLWYGGGLISTGELSAGDLTAFLMYSLYTGFNIGNLSSTYTELRRASGAAARVFAVVDRVPGMELEGHGGDRSAFWHDAAPPSAVETLPRAKGRVEFEHVTFSYPTRPDAPILTGFSLALESGSTTALVGASGSGKSTVGALLTRLYDPSSSPGGTGRVLLDGVDITAMPPVFLRSQVGIVSQEPVLFAASIGDNIRYGRPEASDVEVEAAARLAMAHDFIATFPQGYATPVGERGTQLSGGQKQRIAIARALLKDPPVLILDEATSALDAESESLVNAALATAMKGRTVLTIAHRLSTMRSAGSVAVLAGGRVVERGPFEALAGDEGSVFRALIERQLLK